MLPPTQSIHAVGLAIKTDRSTPSPEEFLKRTRGHHVYFDGMRARTRQINNRAVRYGIKVAYVFPRTLGSGAVLAFNAFKRASGMPARGVKIHRGCKSAAVAGEARIGHARANGLPQLAAGYEGLRFVVQANDDCSLHKLAGLWQVRVRG